jgi:hypothetical protein
MGQQAARRVHTGLHHEMQLGDDLLVGQRLPVDTGLGQRTEYVVRHLGEGPPPSELGGEQVLQPVIARSDVGRTRSFEDRPVFGPLAELLRRVGGQAHDVCHHNAGDHCGVVAMQIGHFGRYQPVDQLVADGAHQWLELGNAMRSERGVVEASHFAVTRFLHLAEEQLFERHFLHAIQPGVRG